MSEREGECIGNTSTNTRKALGGVQYSSETKNEGTGREQKGNTAKRHGSMGGVQYSSEVKIGENAKGTGVEHGNNFGSEPGWRAIVAPY
jgi:hypothetical protein